jgi:predicted dehydrogenase
MLNVGLVGLGPEWEHRYRPALAKLGRRLAVRSVHSSIVSQAVQAAAELGCDVAPGLLSLMERDDVQAILVLDTAWYGSVPAQFACQVGKPAFLASRLAHHVCEAGELLRQAAQTGVTLMPDFGHRYTPATSRLRELIATRLGRPQILVVDVAAAFHPAAIIQNTVAESALPEVARDVLAVAVDWSMNLVGALPLEVRAARNGSVVDRLELNVEFRRPSGGGAAPTALIRLAANSTAPSTNGSETSIALRASVECEHGLALLEGPQQVTWYVRKGELAKGNLAGRELTSGELAIGELAGERFAESLASDRPDVEVMLDHFSRRVVGGLIPVPTLDDLCRALGFVDAAFRAVS